jgi:hypothetical protein
MTKERLEQLKALKQQGSQKSKDKSFQQMSAKEKNELIEIALKMLGIIK